MPRKTILVAVGGAALFCAVSAASLAILPSPHSALHYMLAGTLATAVLLAVALVYYSAVRLAARKKRS